MESVTATVVLAKSSVEIYFFMILPLFRLVYFSIILLIVSFSNFQFLWALKVSPGLLVLGSLSMPTKIES